MTGAPEGAVRTVSLPDGRTLGYAEYGDPNGRPVVNCHGGLSCHLELEPADSAARAAGVRLVAPDRPGIGRSDRRRGRTVGEWADDLAVLADQLGIDHFAVMGWSFGAPYAAACAARLPRRVTSTALVAGAVPLDWPSAGGRYASRTDAVLARLCRHAPPVASSAIRTMGVVAHRAPSRWVRLGAAEMTPSDLASIRRDGATAFAHSIAEGCRRPGGVVDDYLAYELPWGFTYEELVGPVHVWQGTDDTFVSAACSEEAARRIPGSRLTLLPGYGHFLARDHWAQIFAGLADPASTGEPPPTQ